MITKASSEDSVGTSFFGVEFVATPEELLQVFGPSDWDGNDGEDKVNFRWVLKTKEENVFTIYDWKEYRSLNMNENISWHIGSTDKIISIDAYDQVLEALEAVR